MGAGWKRRAILKSGLLVAAALPLNACLASRSRGVAGATNELVFADIGKGLAAVNAGTGQIAFTTPRAVALPSWSRLFSSTSDGDTTRVAILDGRTGAEQRAQDVEGNLDVKVVSGSGRLLVLGEPREEGANPWLPAGRERTTIVVLDTHTGRVRRYMLLGNYEPEAFSIDDSQLFVIEYLPPANPDRYRVRRLELASYGVVPVASRAAAIAAGSGFKLPPGQITVEEEMRGTGRMHVLAPDQKILYTLYTKQRDHVHVRDKAKGRSAPTSSGVQAFVHVLSLADVWAYCLDLPMPFGMGPASAHALAISPDGSRLYVADRSSGALAVADTKSLLVTQTANVGKGTDEGKSAVAQVGLGDKLYLANGSEVLVVDAATLAAKQRWTVDDAVAGLGISPDGRRAYVGVGNRVLVVDAGNGNVVRALTLPSLEAIVHVVRAAQA